VRLRTALVLILLAAVAAFGSDSAPPETAAGVVRLPFPVGEELVYRIYWGVFPVGKTRIVSRWIEEDGRKLLAIRYRTRSNRIVAALYPVDDVIECIIEPVTFLPVRFKVVLKEGPHRRDEVTWFDHAAGVARWESRVKEKCKEYPIEPDTRDVVSFMYHLRSQRFEAGREYPYRVMADDKIYDLILKADKQETVTLRGFGDVPAVRLEPKAAFHGLFIRKGRMTVWVSRDDRNLCAKLVGSVPVASIRAVLSEVHGPGDDSWVTQTRERLAREPEEDEPEVERALRELDTENPTPGS
jgi:hypothetical protein